jgi:eukaryotic-like serine/threonine-protein kinase
MNPPNAHSQSSVRPKDPQALMPERVGKYDLLLPIASGGMATVYLARSTGLGGFERPVALKLTHAHLRDELGYCGDLIEEAKLGVRVRHANVVATVDVGEDPCGVYLVMEYVEGESLSGLLRLSAATGSALPVPIGIRILLDALAGLHAAHELTDESGASLGLVHRDFSPQNILVGTDGVARLTDFGVAKAASRLGHTATGLVKGKLGYMAPEQARGQVTDRRCDVWAAGVVAWETLTGRRLFRARNTVATLLELVTREPPRIRSLFPEVPRAIDEAVARALTPDPERRCASAADFADALRDACESAQLIATSREVARHVRALVGARLCERRARAIEVSSLRARTAELRTSSGIAVEATPSSGVLASGLPEPAMVHPEHTGLTHAASVTDLERSSRHKLLLTALAVGLMVAIGVGLSALAKGGGGKPPLLAAGLLPKLTLAHLTPSPPPPPPAFSQRAAEVPVPEWQRPARTQLTRPTAVARRPSSAPASAPTSPIPRSPYR